MTFVPSPNQQAYFDWILKESGNAVLEAVAGAGKTTTIVQGLRFMGGKIFLGAYNKKMATELQERVANMQNVKASTFHSAGYSALRFAFGKFCALKVDEKKVRNIAEQMIVNELEEALRQMMGSVCKMVSMAKNRGIGALIDISNDSAWVEMIEHYDLDSDLPEGCDLNKAISYSKTILAKSNEDLSVVDFDDMVYLPIVKKVRMFQHDWVLIDEAQDTNSTRRELARMMLKPTGRLVAVGDPCQAIFGFTGADNDSLQQIVDQFKCKTLPLTVSYRCPKAVVKHARNWVQHIEAHESAPEGEVLHIKYENLIPMLTNQDAILCRYNKYLAALCFKLIRTGIPAKIEGRSIGEGLIRLCNKWKVKNIDALRNRLEKYMENEVSKAVAKKQEDRAERIKDQVETMFVLINRAEEQKKTTVFELTEMIRSMFEDEVSSKGVLTLCSCHKSKGMEWDRVFIIGRSELMPSRMAKQPWQVMQERNLLYVAVTRAKKILVEVEGINAILGKEQN